MRIVGPVHRDSPNLTHLFAFFAHLVDLLIILIIHICEPFLFSRTININAATMHREVSEYLFWQSSRIRQKHQNMFDKWVNRHSLVCEIPLEPADLPEFHTLGEGTAFLHVLDNFSTMQALSKIENEYACKMLSFIDAFNNSVALPLSIDGCRVCDLAVNIPKRTRRCRWAYKIWNDVRLIHCFAPGTVPTRWDYNNLNFRLGMPPFLFDKQGLILVSRYWKRRTPISRRFLAYQEQRGISGWYLYKGVLLRVTWWHGADYGSARSRFLPTRSPLRGRGKSIKIQHYVNLYQKRYGLCWPPTRKHVFCTESGRAKDSSYTGHHSNKINL